MKYQSYSEQSRRNFLKLGGSVLAGLLLPLHGFSLNKTTMETKSQYDVIIVGGSYSGLAAALALGRALKSVLVIDSGQPCNKQTPHSHNFITQDGATPQYISEEARKQVAHYKTVSFYDGLAINGVKTKKGFEITTDLGDEFTSKKLVFATGVKDIMPNLKGFSECWGISVLHCPYCHGYEVKQEATGILGNGEYGFDFSSLISNWTKDLTLYTDGQSTLTQEQTAILKRNSISIIDKEIEEIKHHQGQVTQLVFKDGTSAQPKALYAHLPFKQHCLIPEHLGCSFNEDGYILIDELQKTTVDGVYACGDNTTRMRTVANAVAMGTKTGMMLSHEMIIQEFK